eukprot:5476313-Pleurochrysis_carterae.AAC.1
MHRRKLGRRGHGGERVIHVLTPCLVGAQEAKRRWVMHRDEGPKRGIVRGAISSLYSLRGITSEGEGVSVARDQVLQVRLPLRALQASPQLVEV